MIKKIICPSDFSTAAVNATEYAAELAQELNIPLQILNVQSLFPVVAVPAGMNINERVYESSEELAKNCSEINKLFHIPCTYEIIATSEGLSKSIASDAGRDNLIVMGTNGPDDITQFFFGTNAYHVIKKAKSYVLMVPENVTYKTLRKIVFAWNLESNNNVLLANLNELIPIFNPKIIFTPSVTFLHISKEGSEITPETFLTLKNEIAKEIKEKIKVDFEQLASDDIPAAMNKYMRSSKSDILMMSLQHRGVIENLFHRPVSKQIIETAEYPILLMHNERTNSN